MAVLEQVCYVSQNENPGEKNFLEKEHFSSSFQDILSLQVRTEAMKIRK